MCSLEKEPERLTVGRETTIPNRRSSGSRALRMPRSSSWRMGGGCGTGPKTMLLVWLLVLASFETVSGIPYKRAVRLCSKNLSDALQILCKDNGYNEPFSQSGESSSQDAAGPGLVEECCHHSCSVEQLQQYCKPTSDKQQSGSSDVQ